MQRLPPLDGAGHARLSRSAALRCRADLQRLRLLGQVRALTALLSHALSYAVNGILHSDVRQCN